MDLMETQRTYKGSSIWRLKNGTQEIIDKLSGRLSAEKDVKLHLNEPIVSLEVDDGKKANSIHLKTKSTEDTYDIVISAISSKSNYLIFITIIPKTVQGPSHQNVFIRLFFFQKDLSHHRFLNRDSFIT